jgi:sulfofructose kinase
VLQALSAENVDCTSCERLPGLATAVSAIFMNARGDRSIVTYRDERVANAIPASPQAIVATADAVMADNRFPAYVRPICEAARRRGIPVVLDGDRPTVVDDALFGIASHVIFSAECLRETTGIADLAAGLRRIAQQTAAFLAVSNGPDDILYLQDGKLARSPVFRIAVVDTLGAGDALHGGFALALAEGQSEAAALRFGSAVAGIKCSRLGGSDGAPRRAEVEALLAGR